MQQHGSKYFPADPPPPTADPSGGFKRPTFIFSEYGHVAYKIKVSDAFGNMEANILPATHPPSTLGVGSQGQKINFFQNMVMLHIKLTGIRNAWYFADIPLPWGGVKRSNANVSEYGHVAYQLKGNDACSNMVANVLPADPLSHLGWGLKGQN